jgi:phosphoglycolate phosphatase
LTYQALVLFDIDGTLVRRAGQQHRDALAHGIRRVTGLETTTDGIPLYGMLDPVILAEMMRRAGARAGLVKESMPAIIRAAERYYLRECPELGRKRCPGAEAALRRLQNRGILLGLVTGNLTRIGWRKMERAGLREYFRFGAFGEMARTRGGLAKLAIREARRRGWIDRKASISLVGDAPADVAAARENGIRAIAVQTGVAAALAELADLRPDFLLGTLRELKVEMVGA